MIRLNNQRYWRFAAVDPATNEFLHVSLFPTRNEWTTLQFFRELQYHHDVADDTFIVGNSWTLQNTLDRLGLDYCYETHGRRNSIERVYKEIKRRTNQFANHIRHADPDTVATWLQARAFWQNQLSEQCR